MDSTFVDILKDVTLQSIEFVKLNSPYLWAMARQRVFAVVIAGILAGAVLTLLSVIGSYIIHKFAQREDDNEIYWYLLVFAMIFVIGMGVILGNLPTLFSIDYATMEKIITLIKP